MIFCILLLVACAPAFPVCADQVDDFFREEMARRRIPAVVVKIVQDARDVKTAAYGFAKLELGVPATTNTDETVAATFARGVAGYYFKGGNRST